MNIADGNESVQFRFLIAPWDLQVAGKHIAVRYEGLFSFLLELSRPHIAIPQEAEGHFVFITPDQGIFEQQAIDKHTALISFHQHRHGVRDIIIYSPNKEGVYKVICAVPMRIPPQIEITFPDAEHSAEIVQASESVIRFKVKNRYGHTVKDEVKITSVALHAEL